MSEYICHFKVKGRGRTHKVCPKCESVVPLSMFNFRKSGVPQSYCKSCYIENGVKWAAENPERHRANRVKTYHKDIDESRSRQRAWAHANKTKISGYMAAYALKNKEKMRRDRKRKWRENKEVLSAKHREWREKNPGSAAERGTRYRAAKIRAIPSWANLDRIKSIYEACAKITERTGVPHQVDHMVPLQSDLVCGLHVHENLAIIPASMNQAKSNREWPGMFGVDQ